MVLGLNPCLTVYAFVSSEYTFLSAKKEMYSPLGSLAEIFVLNGTAVVDQREGKGVSEGDQYTRQKRAKKKDNCTSAE